MGLTSAPWPRGSFLVGENLFNSHILQNLFLVGVFLIRVKHETRDISLYIHVCRPSKNMLDPSASSRQSRGGLSALLQELYLLAALYWITPSALSDGLWSLIRNSFILYIYIYIYIPEKGAFIDWFLEQPLLNVKARGLIQMASFLKYLFKLFNGLYHCPVFFYVHGLEVIVHLHHNYVAFACGHVIFA